MDLPSLTTTHLLETLVAGDDQLVWQQFVERQMSPMVSVLRRVGVAERDAPDVAQEALLQFVRDLRGGKYDRERGRLRSWLMGIARHRALDHLRRSGAQRAVADFDLESVPDVPQLESVWEAELRAQILKDAWSALVRGSEFSADTLEAFRLHGLEGVPPKEAAQRLGIDVALVYKAKHRCLGRLRELIGERTAFYELGS